ncbi:hypothetical protein [Yunchengibacter salinarum]|uniref:hypothetical protein n=1 Tax=Yunchengibacter salinarum TaxID=3133399 RepID=UPI0035B62B18
MIRTIRPALLFLLLAVFFGVQAGVSAHETDHLDQRIHDECVLCQAGDHTPGHAPAPAPMVDAPLTAALRAKAPAPAPLRGRQSNPTAIRGPP